MGGLLARSLVVALCALPAAVLVAGGMAGRLGANPVETLTDQTGEWGLRFVLLALAATPLRRLIGWNFLLIHRRAIGLAGFAYVAAHLLVYLWLEQAFVWPVILDDILERPFIALGVAAFIGLLPLALTSWDGAVRRLGWQVWRRLHRLVYGAAILGVLHYWLLVKADVREPAIYAMILGVLLAMRLKPARWPARLRGRSVRPP